MKKSIRVLPILLCVVLLSACGSGLSETEIRDLYASLIEAAQPLNVVYYGEGLPMADVSADASAEDVDAEIRVSRYMPVADSAAYADEAEIRAATEAVFSDEMCEYLFEIGFSGVSVTDADGETQLVSYARYIEQDGVLTVRSDLADDAIPVNRTYDFANMTVLIDEAGRIVASFPTFLDGEASVSVKVTLKKTPDGWRLDSPTY